MVKKWQVIIVEDEYLARENLKIILTTRYEDIEVVGVAETAKEALQLFKDIKTIDGVFIDIVLETEGDRSGLDLAANLSRRENPPWLIFTTAYKKHALEAIKSHPADYLLKPLDASKLDIALDYIRQGGNKKLVINSPMDDKGISIKVGKEITPCQPSEILYVSAIKGTKTVKIKLINGKTLSNVAGTLIIWKNILNNHYFCQIHRTHIVNLREVSLPQKGTHEVVFKCCNDSLPIGETFYEELSKRLQNGDF